MTKQEQANQIVANNTNLSRKEVIAIIRDKLGMTDAGASTYYYNAMKKLKNADKTATVHQQLSEETGVPALKPAGDWTDGWTARQRALRAELDQMIAKIDVNEIPMFLRK